MPSCRCAEIGLMLPPPPTRLPGDRLSASTVTHEGHPLYPLSLPVSFFLSSHYHSAFLKSLVNKLWQLAKEAFAVHTILANGLGARNDKLYSAVTSTFFYLFICLFRWRLINGIFHRNNLPAKADHIIWWLLCDEYNVVLRVDLFYILCF